MGNFGQYDTRTGWTGNSPLFDHATDDPDVVAGANALAQAGRSSAFMGTYLHHSAFTTFSATRWADSRIRKDPCLPGFAHPFGGGAQNNSGALSFEARAICGLFGNDDCGEDWDIPKGPCDPPDPSRPGWEEQLDDGPPEGPPEDPYFSPPSTGKCPAHKDAGDCKPPRVDARPCEMSRLPVEEARGLFDLVVDSSLGTVDPDWTDLIEYAWALLLDNLDIIEWIACVITGETVHSAHKDAWGSIWDFVTLGTYKTLAQCLTDSIQGRAPDVTIKLQDKQIDGSPFNSLRFLQGGKIRIRTGNYQWEDNYVGNYKDTEAGSCARFCIVADFAATLLHELVHTCATDVVWNDASGDCRPSYLMENCFRWALGRRYPDLVKPELTQPPEAVGGGLFPLLKAPTAPATACWFYSDDCLWLNDEVTYPNDPPNSCK